MQVAVVEYDVMEAGARILTRYMDVNYEFYDFENCESVMFRSLPLIEVDVYAALMHERGNLGRAAKLLCRPRRVLTDWMRSVPEMHQVLDEIRDTRIDNIQDSVISAAELGDGAQARFVLTTLGKERGFTTRVESTGKDGAPLDRVISDRISDEQLLRIAKEVQARAGAIEGEYNVVDG